MTGVQTCALPIFFQQTPNRKWQMGYLMEKDNRPDAGGCRHGSGRWLSRSRFAIQDGRVKEVLVTLEGENLTEVLDEPQSPRIEERLAGLDLSLPEGCRGEVNLEVEDWTSQLTRTLDRGFVLTIDYVSRAEINCTVGQRETVPLKGWGVSIDMSWSVRALA